MSTSVTKERQEGRKKLGTERRPCKVKTLPNIWLTFCEFCNNKLNYEFNVFLNETECFDYVPLKQAYCKKVFQMIEFYFIALKILIPCSGRARLQSNPR